MYQVSAQVNVKCKWYYLGTNLTLLYSEWPKLHRVLAVLSANGLKLAKVKKKEKTWVSLGVKALASKVRSTIIEKTFLIRQQILP